MRCLHCGKEMTPDEPCYDYYQFLDGETMGQCEACLADQADPFAMTPLEKAAAYTNPGLPRNLTETSE